MTTTWTSHLVQTRSYFNAICGYLALLTAFNTSYMHHFPYTQ